MENEIVEILREINDSFPKEYAEVDLLDSGLLDSLGVVQLITRIQEKYGFEVDIDDIIPENFKSVNNIVMLMKKYEEDVK